MTETPTSRPLLRYLKFEICMDTKALEERAFANLAKWGRQDLETLALAVAEESGEVAQAVLKFRWERGKVACIREEAIDLGALCLQIISLIDNPPCAACDRGDFSMGHHERCAKGRGV